MKSTTRLTLLLVFLTVSLVSSVGWFAVRTSNRMQMTQTESPLRTVLSARGTDPNVALDNALNVVQQDNFDVSLVVEYTNGAVSVLKRGSTPFLQSLTSGELRASRNSVLVTPQHQGFVVSSMDIGGGDSLVIAASTKTITREAHHLEIVVVVIGFLIGLVFIAGARLLLRKDTRAISALVAYAGQVASGDTSTDVRAQARSSDFVDLESSLQQMVASLRERIALESRTAKAMEQFVGDASHELRTPLTVIKGYNELMTNPSISDELRSRALARTAAEVDRMEALVEDLLFLAQLGDGPRPELGEVNASELVRSRCGEFSADHRLTAIKLNIERDLRIRGSEALLGRILQNALTNIQRHAGDVAVEVSLVQHQNEVTLSIDDAGPGLPNYDQGIQRFMRFSQDRDRTSGGSGLGMSIMADIAKSLGGSMEVSPSPLGGLRLVFSFPLA